MATLGPRQYFRDDSSFVFLTAADVNGALAGSPLPVANGGTGRASLTTLSATAGNPAGTAAGPVMMGLGATFTFTPSGMQAVISISGQLSNNTGGDGAAANLRYGTGAAPINGAAVVGTGVAVQAIAAATANTIYPFTTIAAISGLSPGVPVWFDMDLKMLVGGTASIFNPSATAWDL